MNILYINKQKPFSNIVAGFSIQAIAMIFRNITSSEFIYAVICLVGWIYIIKGLVALYPRMNSRFGRLYGGLLVIYICLAIIMIIRGYMIDYPYIWFTPMGFINCHFFYPSYILPYFMPIFAFIKAEDYDFKCLVSWSRVFGVLTILSFIFILPSLMSASARQAAGVSGDIRAESYLFYGNLSVNVVVILFCSKYITKKIWKINIAGLCCSLLIFLLAGRRGDSAITALLIIISLYFYAQNFNRVEKFWRSLVLVMIGIAAVGYFINGSTFSYIQKRGMHDNRSAVDEALMSQMDDTQKWFGKGLNGRYYFNLHLKHDRFNGWRYLSETGYYNLVLKGGYVFAWIYILVILIPSLSGIFRSNNVLCKALGAFMFVSLLQLYPFGHLMFNLQFLVIWSGVKLCMTKRILKSSDQEIYQHYFIQ